MNSQTLDIGNNSIPILTKRHKRAKSIKLRVVDGKIHVTLPYFVPKILGINFAKKNKTWVLQQLKTTQPPQYTPAQIAHLKVKTRKILKTRLPVFNQHYGFDYKRVIIRHQKTRWGSCSSNQTLSFNCKLALLPAKIADYIIVHELCHLKEMNHSSKFWTLVSQQIPNHKSIRRQLKKLQSSL